MRTRYRFIVVALLLIAPFNSRAQSNNVVPKSLFGYTLGVPGQEAQRIREFSSATTADAIIRHVIIGGVDFNVTLSLLSGKVAVVTADYPPNHFELVLEALRDKFGEYKLETSIIKTGAGVEYAQATAHWMFPDGSIAYLKRYSSNIEQGSLVLTSKDMIDKIAKERHEQLLNLKKGL